MDRLYGQVCQVARRSTVYVQFGKTDCQGIGWRKNQTDRWPGQGIGKRRKNQRKPAIQIANRDQAFRLVRQGNRAIKRNNAQGICRGTKKRPPDACDYI